MKLEELKDQYKLKEEHMVLLFDVLYTYHEFDTLYSFEELEVFFCAIKILEKPDSYYLKSLTFLLEIGLIEFINDREVEFINDREAIFFIAREDIREIELLKELEKEVY